MFNPDPKPNPRAKSKPSRIKPRSKKRSKQEREYSKVRIKFLAENSRCERCRGLATEIHHRKGRENTLLIAVEYFMAVCRRCHKYIENNPIEAKERGWSLSRG